MAKKETPKTQLTLGGGELRTRDDGSQYVYDPVGKKNYSVDTAQGQFLLGKDPSKAKKSGGNENYMVDAYKGMLKGGNTSGPGTTAAPTLSSETTSQISQLDKQIEMLTKSAQGEGLGSYRNQKIKELKKQKEYLLAGFDVNGKQVKTGSTPSTDLAPGSTPSTGTTDTTGTSTTPSTTSTDTGTSQTPTTTAAADTGTQTSEDIAKMKEDFITSLGDAGQKVNDAITAYEAAAGQSVDFNNPDFQQKIKEAVQNGASDGEIKSIISSHLVPGVRPDAAVPENESPDLIALEDSALKGEALSEEDLTSAKDAYAKGYMDEEEYKAYLEKHQPSAADTLVKQEQNPEFKYVEAPEITIATALSNTGSLDFTGMSSMIAALTGGKPVSEMTSAELNQIMLAQMQLTASSEYQDKLTALYGNMKDRALQAYESSKDDVDLATSEIDNILNGKDSTATTLSSLMVRVAQNSKDTNMMSLKAQEKALNAEYEFTYNKMLEQNSRLEGYMKAKLNWMGAADSSSGLTTLAMAVDNAQQTLLLYQGKHEANMLQLEAQKTSIMNDYYNSVTEQLLNLQGEKGNALAAYNDKLDQIEGNELASNQEAQTMQLNVLSGLVSNLHQLDQEQKSWEYQLAQDAYNKAWKEMEWTHDIEKESKAQAASNLDMLAQAYNGLSFDSVDPQAQQSMVEMARLLGLPDSFPREMLDAQIRAASSSGSGSGSSSSQYAAYAQYAAQQAASQGISMSDWLDTNTQFDSNSKDLIQQAYVDSQIEGQLAQDEKTTEALNTLGISWDDLAKAGETNKKKQKEHAWNMLTNIVTGGSSLVNISPIK